MSTPTTPPGDAEHPASPTEPLPAAALEPPAAAQEPAAAGPAATAPVPPAVPAAPAGYGGGAWPPGALPPTAPAAVSPWRRRFSLSPLAAGIVALVLLVVGFGGGAVTQKAFSHNNNPPFSRARFGPGFRGHFPGGTAPRGFGGQRPGFGQRPGSGQRQLPGPGATPGQRPTSLPSPTATGSGT